MQMLRKVHWRNLWNWTSESDGVGSAVHLTDDAGATGKTLCGRVFPAHKGYSSSLKICKRCINKAYKAGHPKGFTAKLEWVPSIAD